jgi:hypothetical protein
MKAKGEGSGDLSTSQKKRRNDHVHKEPNRCPRSRGDCHRCPRVCKSASEAHCPQCFRRRVRVFRQSRRGGRQPGSAACEQQPERSLLTRSLPGFWHQPGLTHAMLGPWLVTGTETRVNVGQGSSIGEADVIYPSALHRARRHAHLLGVIQRIVGPTLYWDGGAGRVGAVSSRVHAPAPGGTALHLLKETIW